LEGVPETLKPLPYPALRGRKRVALRLKGERGASRGGEGRG